MRHDDELENEDDCGHDAEDLAKPSDMVVQCDSVLLDTPARAHRRSLPTFDLATIFPVLYQLAIGHTWNHSWLPQAVVPSLFHCPGPIETRAGDHGHDGLPGIHQVVGHPPSSASPLHRHRQRSLLCREGTVPLAHGLDLC